MSPVSGYKGDCTFQSEIGPCTRPIYAKNMCKVHYTRLLRGTQKPDRPVRAKNSDLIVMPNTRVPEPVALELEYVAQQAGISTYMLMAKILEEWYARHQETKTKVKAPWTE